MNWKTTWPKAYPDTQASGTVKATPEDFIVDEIPLFSSAAVSGLDANNDVGEHIYLHIKKRNVNTQWVAKLLAEFCGVKENDVGYSGLKDRHAVTTQWFSIYLPLRNLKEEIVFPKLLEAQTIFDNDELIQEEGEFIEVLEQTRHNKKLRPGDLIGNRFQLVIRDVQGSIEAIERNLAAIKEHGVPNYFGDQRFGHDYGNLDKAYTMFLPKEQGGRRERNKKKRGLYLSAARSYFFNLVVAERIETNLWGQSLVGDINIDSSVISNADQATAPLWGRGRLTSTDETLAVEEKIAASLNQEFEGFLEGLEHSGLDQERRLITAKVEGLSWSWQDGHLQLSFALPAGYYATSVLHEVLQVSEPQTEAAT